MADLFNNSNPVDYDTQTANKPSLYQNQLNTVRNEEQIRLENRKKYGVELSDEEYSQINDLIAYAENPDEESHKIASAILVSQNTKIPLAESYQNLDSYIQGLWGDGEKTSSYKNAFVAISDMFAMGANNIKIGVLGNKIIQAEKDGDEEALQLYMKEYKAYMDDNATRQDNAPRTWATKVLECGAQSAPYTGAVSGAALFGSLLGPAGSVGASILTSTTLMRGEIYMDLRAKGIEPEIARKASLVSAIPQAIIEAGLGEAAAWAGAGLKLLGKGASKTVSSKVAEGLANTMQAKFHFGPGSKLAVRALSEYLGNLTEEGAEEYLQEGVGAIVENEAIKAQTKVNQAKRAEILDTASNELGEQFTKDFEAELLKQYPDLETQSFGEIHKNMVESFKGGVMGAIALGIVPTSINSVCTAADYNLIKEAAENIPSKEMFKKVVKESEGAKKVFEQFGDEKAQNDAISQVWENAQSTRDKRDAELIAGTKETTAFSENMEEAPKENDEGETEVIPAARDDKGRLYTEKDTETETEDGKKKGSFKVGNAEAGDKNLYGYINYTLDEKNNTVTIDDFKMTAYRRGLTQEFFDEFAQEFAGVNINWNPLTKAGKDLKALLVSKNFTGKNNGLNYYTQENLIEAETRRSLNKQLIKYMPNLNHDQRSAAIALLEAGARRQGYSLSDYVSNTFGNKIFGELKELNGQITQAQRQEMKGATDIKQYGNQIKAVIYAGEKADFSTFAHEVSHIWQAQLTGELKEQAEKAFNVKNGDWINSTFTFADGHTENSAEAFARGFEDYLRSGKAPNAEMKTMFQKFAEFLQDVYRSLKNFINMSPEIENVYNQLMSADDSVLALAEKAVQQGDREYIAELKANKKAQAEAEEKAKAEAKENAEQAAKEKADEESEITLSDENISEPDLSPIEESAEEETAAKVEEKDNVVHTEEEANKTLEDLLNFFGEKAQEETEDQTLNAYKDETLEALEGMSFAKNEAEEVIKTVTNKDETLAVKVETTTETAGKARDNEFYIFQLAGREGIKNLVSAQERARRIESYYEALRLAENENNTARRIKLLTGWEKNASGKWVYETDDSIATVNSKLAEIINEGRADALSDKQIPSFALSAIYKNDELYEMYPLAKDFTVQFFTDKLGVNAFIKADGIAVNTTGLTDSNVLKRRLIHEIQHIIQAVENYAEGNDDISGAGIHGKDFNELWQSLKEAQTSDSKMYDASALELNMDKYLNNEAEIDARNVARRALMSANERRASLLSDTTDVKSLPMLFQLIGEQGAENLDKAEEVTTRRDNLKIAKDMENAGKDAKATRFATGWEKGTEGLWRYETDDNKVNFYDEERYPRRHLTEDEEFKKIDKAIKDSGYDFEKINIQDKQYWESVIDSENEYVRQFIDFDDGKEIWKKTVDLERVLNAPELFKAYPELKSIQFKIESLSGGTMGEYNPKTNTIVLDKYANKGTLLHEIQHAIQRIEGFAFGSNLEAFEENEDVSEITKALASFADYKKEDIENHIGQKGIEEYKALGLTDEQIKELSPDIEGLGTREEIIERMIKNNGLDDTYREIQEAKKLVDNVGKVEVDGKVYPSKNEAYRSVAGEVEARNVQKRINMTPEERLNTLLTETADVAPEDQIVLFDGVTSESRDTEKSLYGIHNLREDALRHVLKMGGIANPSMAVMDINKPGFNNFGEISLIPYNYMLEKGPGNKGTFGADIYSPRYPSVENVVTSLGEKKIRSILWAVADANSDLAEELAEKIESRINNAYGGLSKAQIDELGLQIPFLAEKGKTDFYKYNETKFSPEILSKFEEYTKGYLSDEQLTELYKMFETNEEIIKELTEENGNINHNVLMNFESQLHRAVRTANKVDLWSTIKAAQEIIEGDAELKKQFDEYANEKYNSIERIERIFNGYTPSGNRKYLSHTLENVSKYMKQQGLQGGENFSYGLGSTRAKFTPKFTTLAQIKKAKDRLVTHEEFEEIKDKMNEQYDEICNMLRGDNDYDVGGARFEEAFTTRGVDPISYIKNEYDIDLTEEEANELRSFAEALRVMPTEYFETKFERPVYLNEFAAAIIPANLAQDLKDELAKAGLQIKEYAETENREEVTKQALREFDATRRILFQVDMTPEDFSDNVKHEGDFVLTKSGSKDFGEISKEIGKEIRRQAGKIRLEIGFQDNESKKGQGEAHIERENRLKQLKLFGFENARDFVEYVSQNFDSIYQGGGSALILSVFNNNNYDIEYIELKPHKDGDYWNVTSAVVARPNYLNNKTLLWSKPSSSVVTSEMGRAQSNQQLMSPSAIVTDTSDNQNNTTSGGNVNNLLFQTQEELIKEAASFDNWEEFMEWEESHGALEEVTPIPKEADAAWYKATWELAKGITHKEQENKTTDESMTQQTKDALFMVHMEQPGVLENFLKEVNYINDLDFETMGNAVDAEEQAERDRQAQLKDYIAHKLRHGSWISNATRVANGKELTPATRKRLLNLIRLASREYRDVYTQITGDQEYAVPKNESYFESHIANNAKKLNKLLTPEEALAMSPEQLRALADSLSDELSNKEISQKIKNGTLKMDDELKNYIVRLDRRVKDAEERYDQLKKETEEDYNRINDYAQRRLLDTYEELLRARAKLNNKKNILDKKIAKGIKITERYQKDVYKAQSTYDDIFKTWNNLTAVNKISAEVQEAMKRKEEYIAAVEEQAKLKNDKAILTQISDMRKKLVKSAMRRVPFERINYEQAKTIIAIQRIFYPNLKFDVNKWIGERPIYLKGIAAEYLTNAEKRAEIDKTLNYKRTHAQSDGAKNRIEALQELLKNLKTSDDVDKWTTKEKNLLMRYIPQKDWAKELNLEALEKERADSIQLDIDEEGYTETKLVKLPNGKEEIMVYTRPKFSEEIGQMVKDALGADLYNQLVNKPFEDWTTNEMEKFTKRIDEIYREGRDELEAKRQAKKDEAKEIRDRISEVVHNTGIEINDTDTPEEKEEKLAAINKILGNDEIVKGTFASKKNKQSGKLGKLLHGFADANVRRFARILDNYSEGVNSTELFFKENECYIAEQEMLRKRQAKINAILKENDIKIDDLYKTVIVNGNEYSYDDLLYVLAADKDYETKDNDKGVNDALETDPMADNDDYAPTARNAVMFGNLGSRNSDLLMKESNKELDEQTKERHANNDFTEEEQKALDTGYSIISTPGTKSFIADCHRDYAILLNAAKNMLKENPKFERLLEAIDADYTEQFERMQEVCVEEFNAPINRVKKYVPLNRMESNGDTNENRVKEDLLATSGASTGKNFVDKGMTQKRISISPLNQKPVEMGLYKTWADATARTEHFINYAGYVRELNRVYKGRDAQYVRRYIENRYGHGALEYIDNYIAEVANPNATAATGSLDQIVRALRGKTALAYLAWKASGIIKQAATSPWPFMQFMYPHEYLKANLDILTSKGSLYDVIKEKSVYMNNRVFDPVIDLINEQIEKATNPAESKLNEFNMLGMQGLEMIDWVCVAPGWLACYRKKYAELESLNNIETVEAQVKAENEMLDPSDPDRMTSDQIKAEAESRLMSEDDIEKEAVLYADDCTRLCQPSNRKVDLAPLFKSSGPGSEIAKAFLQFQTSLNVIWQNIRYDIPYAMRQKKFKQIAGMILGYVFAGITVGAITEGFESDEDDEEKKRLAALRKFIYYGTTQFTDAIPVIGGIVSGMDNKIIAGNKGLTSSSTDLLPMVTKVKTGTENMFKGNWEKALWNYGEAAGLATGLPVSGTKEVLRAAGIGDNEEGLDFKPESFIGRRD